MIDRRFSYEINNEAKYNWDILNRHIDVRCNRWFIKIKRLRFKNGRMVTFLNSKNSWSVVTRETLFLSSLKLYSVLGPLMWCLQFIFLSMKCLFICKIMSVSKYLCLPVAFLYHGSKPETKLCFLCQHDSKDDIRAVGWWVFFFFKGCVSVCLYHTDGLRARISALADCLPTSPANQRVDC